MELITKLPKTIVLTQCNIFVRFGLIVRYNTGQGTRRIWEDVPCCQQETKKCLTRSELHTAQSETVGLQVFPHCVSKGNNQGHGMF